MSRPTNKTDLVVAANERFDKLWKLIDSISEEKQNAAFPFEDRDRNLRDVLIHLHEWHNMVELWHRIGTIEGSIPDVPGKGYTWKTLPDLNIEIWKRYQDTSLASSKDMLRRSHGIMIDLIESHTNDELFAKGVYKWTKSTTLGAYFVSSTSSHYDWAIKKIKSMMMSKRSIQ